MKFPRVLSKERLSLLSPEDRKIYEYEHSELYVEEYNDEYNVENINEYIDENINYDMQKYNSLTEDYYISESLFNELFDSVYYDKELIKEIGQDDYNLMKKNIYEFIKNNEELNVLNEQTGIAIDYWAKGIKLGWLGKLTAGLLTGLVGLVAWLLMKGKDRLAMVQLKKYMNKIVELVDSGVNKKRPWYSFLIPSRKGQRNTGEYNKACFRTVQETAERNMACLYTQCIYSLGFLNPSRTNFDGITSGFVPEKGSGLDTFSNIVNSFSENNKNVYMPNTNDTLLPVRPDEKIFQNLKLPALPTNFKMLMCNIDYPTKAKQNPNGSLFMKPTEEILKAKGQDIGSAYFNKDITFNNVINTAQKTNEDYVISYDFIRKALFEVESKLTGMDKLSGISGGGLLTGDLADGGLGAELSQEIQGKEETKVNNFQGNIIDAIDNYIRSSVPIVAKLIRAIAGQNSGDRASDDFLKMIIDINSASENKMDSFLKNVSNDLKTLSSANNNRYQEQINQTAEMRSLVSILLTKLNSDNTKDKKKKNDFCNEITKMALRNTGTTSAIKKKFKDAFKDTVENFLNFNKNESLLLKNYINHMELFEDFGDDMDDSDDSNETDTKKVEQTKDKLQTKIQDGFYKTYNNITYVISSKIIGIVENNPENWYIIKNARERMNKLKEAADKEITAKIDLICRTANSGKTDLGDKFKAALSTHPARAEGLKGLWARYSDDLTDRIESRIRSITGDNGNSNILDTIKQFLTVTYPNLIGIMTYYKQLYYLLRLYTEENPIVEYTPEEQQQNNTLDEESILISIQNFKLNTTE